MGDSAFWSGAGAAFLGAIIGGIFTLVGGYLEAHQALKAGKRERVEGLYHDLSNGVWELQVAVEFYKQEHLGGGLSESDQQSLWERKTLGSGIIDKAHLALKIVLEPDHDVFKLILEWRSYHQHLLVLVAAAI